MAFTRILGPGIHTASNINSHNINSTGIITAVSFVGDGSGLTGVASTDNIITGTAATFTGGVDINSDLDVDGHTNLDNVSIAGVTTFSGGLTGTTANFSGNVSVGGTLTYEDVTNVDSVGIVTAREGIRIKYDDKKIILGADDDFEIYHDNSNRSGIRFTNPEFRLVGAVGSSSITLGQSNSSTELSFGEQYAVFQNNGSVDLFYDGTKRFETTDDGAKITGKLETTYGLELEGFLKEEVKITAGKLSDNTDINLDDGMVYYFTTQETTTSTPNVRFSSSSSLNSKMAIGDTVSVTIITTAAAAGYSAQLTIDGSAVTENWVGGSAPSGGGSSGVDIYTYNIIKTADATFTVIANLTKTS